MFSVLAKPFKILIAVFASPSYGLVNLRLVVCAPYSWHLQDVLPPQQYCGFCVVVNTALHIEYDSTHFPVLKQVFMAFIYLHLRAKQMT